MKSFWVDQDQADFNMGFFGINKDYAEEITALLLILTNGEEIKGELAVQPVMSVI